MTDRKLQLKDDSNKSDQEIFRRKILTHNVLACDDRNSNNDNICSALAASESNMKALNAQGGLQEMLIAQMTSIHLLQQKTTALANRTGLIDTRQYLANSAIKLANCFTQQAALLSKLQGNSNQKIVVEHVEVHKGGQAVVGNINSTGGR
tara:strand:+ start:706 stop:1155 length:450 start_codon:yes stop_codon:yes gene_type:complete